MYTQHVWNDTEKKKGLLQRGLITDPRVRPELLSLVAL